MLSEGPEVLTFGSRLSEHLDPFSDTFWDPFRTRCGPILAPILEPSWVQVGAVLVHFLGLHMQSYADLVSETISGPCWTPSNSRKSGFRLSEICYFTF